MKTILCYGDSYTWGCVPGSLNAQTGLWARYPTDKRWTGVLQKELGKQYEVISEGINGRTTNLDEIIPGSPYKNGLKQLPVCLEVHYPIDLIIFMLGTNDTKIQFNRSVEEIAEGMRELIRVIKSSNKGAAAKAPRILLLAPPSTLKVPNLSAQRDDGAIEKSKKIATLYQQLANAERCDFLDTSLFITPSKLDGVHLNENENKLLGCAVAEKVKQIFQLFEDKKISA